MIKWTLTLLALALGWVECHPLRHAARTLAQAPQVPPECANGFNQAYPFCADVTQRTPNSVCCGGMSALGTDCLAAVMASLSSSGGDSFAARGLNDTLTACQIALTGGPPSSPSTPPSSPTPPAPQGNDTDVLPQGKVDTIWRASVTGEGATCAVYTPVTGWAVDNSTSWNATGSNPVTQEEIKALGDVWCGNLTSVPYALLQALDAGGRTAEVAVATFVNYICPTDQSDVWESSIKEFKLLPPLNDSTQALRYVRAFVRAADASGTDACVSVVVLDSSENVVYAEQFPVGAGSGGDEDCTARFSQALGGCGQGAACCDPVQALGERCLAELAASPDVFVAVAFDQVSQACGWGSPAGGDELPDGEVRISWNVLRGQAGIPCPVYSPAVGDFVDGSWPRWVASGADIPTDAEITALGDRWCANRTGALPDMLQALDAGGREAQVAAATYIFFVCPTDQVEVWDFLGEELINSDALNNRNSSLEYIQALVDACDRAGINFCTTVAVVDETTGEVLFNRAIHTGPGPNSTEGCAPNFEQALVICGNDTVPPSAPCCAALDALGSECRATLPSNANATLSSAYNAIAPGCSTPPSPPATLPSGSVALQVNTGETATCSAYVQSNESWVEVPSPTWGPSGSEKPSSADIQAFADQMCPLAEGAGLLVLTAIESGGQSARVATAAIVKAVNEGTCTNDTARNAARVAFVDLVADLETSRMISVMQNFVDACDAMGAGACVSIAVYDPASKQVLYNTTIHTSSSTPVPAGSPPVTSRRRLAHASNAAIKQVHLRGRRAGGST